MGATFIRLNPERLNGRIDATYYRPQFVANEERLRTCGAHIQQLNNLIHSGRRAVYFSTSTMEREEAPDNWVPFLTSDDFGTEGFGIDLNARRYVSPEFADQYPNGRLRANELLVKVKGPNQITAYNSKEPTKRILVSGTIWGALVRNDQIDPHYLVTVLSSDYAVLARSRLRTNLNVEFLSPSDLVELELPVPRNRCAQKYIGDKVRQAELLRASARSRERRFTKLVKGAFPQLDETVSGVVKHGRATSLQLNGKLNPGAYNPNRILIRNYLLQNGGKQVLDIASIETPITSRYKKTDTYIGLDSIGSFCGTINPSTIEQEDVVGSVRLLSEGPVISKLRPYLNKVAYIPSSLNGAFGSTELLCVRAYDSALNWFVYGVLQLQSTVRQLNPVSTGSTHPRVTREDVADTFIPWLDDPVSAGRILENAQREYFASDLLVIAAKLIVEALIEGRVTEDEIAAAQIQLEHGDQTGDRAMLVRLFNDGMDTTEGKRLFGDLDAHYETLQLAEENSKDKPDNGSNDRQ